MELCKVYKVLQNGLTIIGDEAKRIKEIELGDDYIDVGGSIDLDFGKVKPTQLKSGHTNMRWRLRNHIGQKNIDTAPQLFLHMTNKTQKIEQIVRGGSGM